MEHIFIGIPQLETNDSFEKSLSYFIYETRGVYNFDVCRVIGKTRAVGREILVRRFLESGADYLLFLDNDHTGHTLGMLDSLMLLNADVCAIKCYARYFPYQCTLMLEGDIDERYFQTVKLRGVHNCRFVGFGMTLIKRRVFDILKRPFFKCDERGEREDNYFCEKLLNANIIPIGYFDSTLPHQGIDESNIDEMRKKNISKFVQNETNKKLIKNVMKAKKNNGGLTKQEEKMLASSLETLEKRVI